MTREVQASEAKTHLPRLLDEVERGETIIITRHGRAIARLVSRVGRRPQKIDRAIADITELGQETEKAAVEETLSLRSSSFGPSTRRILRRPWRASEWAAKLPR